MNAPKRFGDLTAAQLSIVDALNRRGGLSVPELAQLIDREPPARLGPSVESLRRRRLVRAPIRGAGQVLELTEYGREVAL